MCRRAAQVWIGNSQLFRQSSAPVLHFFPVKGEPDMKRTVSGSLGVLFAAALMTSAQLVTIRAQTNDTALKDHVEYRMETSPAVKKYDINVKVERHDVTLTGTVATEAQKVEAGKLARVEGVEHVNNELTVDRRVDSTLTDRARRGMRRTGEALDDGWITTKVKWFFTGDSLLKGSDISVETNSRVVTLSGTVRTQAARQRAVALADDTDGVTKVVDHLRVQR